MSRIISRNSNSSYSGSNGQSSQNGKMPKYDVFHSIVKLAEQVKK